MIGTGKPERNLAFHAMPAGYDIHLGLVKHVPLRQAPGDVRRREEDVKDLPSPRFFQAGSGEIKEVFFDPVLGPMRLYRAWIVRFRQLVRHRFKGFAARSGSIKTIPQGLMSGVAGGIRAA